MIETDRQISLTQMALFWAATHLISDGEDTQRKTFEDNHSGWVGSYGSKSWDVDPKVHKVLKVNVNILN